MYEFHSVTPFYQQERNRQRPEDQSHHGPESTVEPFGLGALIAENCAANEQNEQRHENGYRHINAPTRKVMDLTLLSRIE
jgi:hypothetical protein